MLRNPDASKDARAQLNRAIGLNSLVVRVQSASSQRNKFQIYNDFVSQLNPSDIDRCLLPGVFLPAIASLDRYSEILLSGDKREWYLSALQRVYQSWITYCSMRPADSHY